MALIFVSSSPESGTSDFYINKSVELTYNQPIDKNSLTDNVIFLVDLASNQNVPVTIALKPSDTKVILLTPLVNLRENTNYRLIVSGVDQGLGYSLIADSTELLGTTTVVLFKTGDNVYHIDTTVEKQASNITLEGDLFLPTNVKALGYEFTVEKVRPKNHTHGVPISITGDNTIRFTFSKALMTGVSYEDWADIKAYPLLQDSQYIGTGGWTGVGENPIPTPQVSVDGKDFIVTFNYTLPQNIAVTVDLNSSIQSIDGDEYGGAMNYIFNTELSTQVYGPEMVKRELISIGDQLYDDYIGALLFKNSIFLWEKTGRSLEFSSYPFAAKRWVLLSTLLDIMEDKDYHKFVLGGTRRQLGDLNVSIDNPIGRLALKIARVQKERDIAFESLFKGWQFKSIAGATRASLFQGDRLWYDVNYRYTDTNYKFYQWNLPVANIYINRHAKTNNPFW
jgi:hypothetical protein